MSNTRSLRSTLVLLMLALILAFGSAQAQTIQPNTTWRNSRGSELTINSIGADGGLVGSYVNNAPGFQCQGVPFAVSGWVEGGLISFAVRWKNATHDCRSITTWVGYLSGSRIVTNWDLVYTDATEQRPLIYRGTDFFEPK